MLLKKCFIVLMLVSVLIIEHDLVQAISMHPDRYRQLIMNHCFNHSNDALHEPLTLGQRRPVGMSIDYFVSLVDKIEQKFHIEQLSAVDMLVMLLNRFHYDGVKNIASEVDWHHDHQMVIPQIQSQQQVIRRAVNDFIFNKINIPKVTFPEDVLSEDEKCAMFYMMSHSINITYLQPSQSPTIQPAPPTTLTKQYGVVSLLNSDQMSISLNRVLLAILAALSKQQIEPFTLTSSQHGNVEMDALLAVTFTDQLVMATFDHIENYATNSFFESEFGANGHWNSTYCQTQFTLDNSKQQPDQTMADIHGAVDGWLIGRSLLDAIARHQPISKLKLSTILNDFYHGQRAQHLAICSSDFQIANMFRKIDDNVIDQAEAYASHLNERYAHFNYQTNRIAGVIHLLETQFRQAIQKSITLKQQECLRIEQIRGRHVKHYSNRADLYIMIDNNAYQYSKFHLEAITRLLVKLKSLDSLGRVTILVNAHPAFDSETMSIENPNVHNYSQHFKVPLHLIAYQTDSIQQATCRLAWYNYRQATINNKKSLLNYLGEFFERDMQLVDQHQQLVSLSSESAFEHRSKNLIWFSLKGHLTYEELSERERAYYYLYRWRLLYLYNIRMFFVSNFEQTLDDDLSKMVFDKQDWFKVNPADFYEPLVIDRLAERIQQTPVAVHLDHTQTFVSHLSSANILKQSWALYPKYFINSRHVHIKFRCSNCANHILHICLGRWLFPERNHSQCYHSDHSSNDHLVEFDIDRPCRWNNMESCSAIYYTIQIHEHHSKSHSNPVNMFDMFTQNYFNVEHLFVGVHNASIELMNGASSLSVCVLLMAILITSACLFVAK